MKVYLMSATYEIHVVSIEKFGDHIGAESERHASVILTPSLNIFVRITPEQIAE